MCVHSHFFEFEYVFWDQWFFSLYTEMNTFFKELFSCYTCEIIYGIGKEFQIILISGSGSGYGWDRMSDNYLVIYLVKFFDLIVYYYASISIDWKIHWWCDLIFRFFSKRNVKYNITYVSSLLDKIVCNDNDFSYKL